MVIRAGSPTLAAIVCALGLAACGGNDAAPEEQTSSAPAATAEASTQAAASSAAAAPDLDGVLRCLQAAGVDAEKQSGLDDREYVGIDYGGGRTTINFAASADDADLTADAAEQYGEVVRAGLIVAVITPDGADDTATVRGCIEPGSAPAATTAPATGGAVAADAPALAEVRSCLTAAGVPSRDPASAATPGTLEIAHTDKSLTVIDFAPSEEDAKLTEKVSKDFGKVLRVGTIVVTMSAAGEKVEDRIRPCLSK